MTCIRLDCSSGATMTLDMVTNGKNHSVPHCDEHIGSAYRSFSRDSWAHRGISVTGITIIKEFS